jgi:hypothetical protein
MTFERLIRFSRNVVGRHRRSKGLVLLEERVWKLVLLRYRLHFFDNILLHGKTDLRYRHVCVPAKFVDGKTGIRLTRNFLINCLYSFLLKLLVIFSLLSSIRSLLICVCV